MIYKMALKDSADEMTFDLLEVPIVDKDIEGAVDNVTLDGNQYTDYLWLKKQFIQKWSILCDDEYTRLRGFYTRQFENADVPSYRLYYGDDIIRNSTLSGERIELSISGVADGTMSLTQMDGNIEQDGTPTPSAPVPVQTVTGRQTVTVTKNYLETYPTPSGTITVANVAVTLNSNGTLTLNGTCNGNGWVEFVQDFRSGTATQTTPVTNLDSTKTYTITIPVVSGTVSGTSCGVNMQFSSSLEGGANIGGSRTITGADGIYRAWVRLYPGAVFNNAVIAPMITEEAQTQEYEINLGKNLIEPKMPTWTYHGVTCTNNGDGSFTLNGTATATATWRISQSTANGHDNMLNLNGTYTLSCGGLQNGMRLVVTQFNVWQTVGAMNDNDTPATFTTDLNDLIIYVAVIDGTTVNNVTIRPMLEKGSTASSYSAYFEPIELCKIGTYQDRVYKENGKWWLEKQTGKVVLNGSETISKGGTTANQYFYANALSNYVKPSNNNQLISHFSNRFTSKTPNQLSGGSVVGSTIRTDNAVGFAFGVSSEINTVDKCKTWLASNNVTVYYPLATPTTTEITNEALVEELEALQDEAISVGLHNIYTDTPNALPTLTFDLTEYLSQSTTIIPETAVRLTLTDGGVINACGCRKDVQLTMRETIE